MLFVGESALRIAVENHNTRVVELLLGCGYNLSRERLYEETNGLAGLVQSGEQEEEEPSDDLHHLLLEHACRPTKLLLQCRQAIRHTVFNHGPHPLHNITQLPLPKRMHDFLLLDDL